MKKHKYSINVPNFEQMKPVFGVMTMLFVIEALPIAIVEC